MSTVAVIRCESYDNVLPALQRGIDLLGGAVKFVNPGENILLKPNLLMAVPPERCATTHPAVFKAAAEIFKETGAKLTYGDSPGFGSPSHAAEKTGIKSAADEIGIEQADFTGGRDAFFEQAIQNKKLFLANGVLDCDGLISISKLKTHAFMKMTGAIKNQFGCIPGVLKGEFHLKLPNPADFARLLVDINLCVRPRLYIMDGIIAMEGNGPMNGKPKPMNVLLLSADPVALDATVCRMLGLDPALTLSITVGQEAGLGEFAEDKIEVAGDDLHSFIDHDFNIDREPMHKMVMGKGITKIMKKLVVSKPVIIKEKCKKCGVCVKMCPVKPAAVDFRGGDKNNVPIYKYKSCIRCFCCQELCPEGAVKVKKQMVRKALNAAISIKTERTIIWKSKS